ncbi:MAG: hypothetical protein HC788_07960 [Sphingopyxis sp.]|nr:hypothetical protein [Sphingopyxis sp.]
MLMRVGEFARTADSVAHDMLRNHLTELLPPSARIVAHGWRPWASASFVGARHWFDVRPGSDADAVATAVLLEQREWTLQGSFVADAAVRPDDGQPGDWRIELLTVED